MASAVAGAARPWAPICVSLAAEALVGETGDVSSMLRDYEDNRDVRIGVYRAVSSKGIDSGPKGSPGEALSALREQFAKEGDPNCLSALLDAVRAIPEAHFEGDGEAKRLWFKASVGLLERLEGSLGEEERATCFELGGRFYSHSTAEDNGAIVRGDRDRSSRFSPAFTDNEPIFTLQDIARIVSLMDDEVFSEDGGSDPVRLAVMKTLTRMVGEAGKEEVTSGI